MYGINAFRSVHVGDLVSLSGRVAEYRAQYRPNDLLLTELERPSNLRVRSSGNTVTPVILGKHRIPPVAPLTHLDDGPDDWLSLPSNITLLETVNATLQPDKYGLDFWESLEGQLVTIESPVAVDFPDMFGSFWAHGGWPVSGKNERGGLSLILGECMLITLRHACSNGGTRVGPDGRPVAHSEAILIGKPIDGSKNPRTMVGMELSTITGVLAYQASPSVLRLCQRS